MSKVKFKKPKTADVKTVVKGVLAFEGGKRLSRGIAGAIPTTDESQSQLVKGSIALAALFAAAAYQGPNKDLFVLTFVGVASEQISDVIDAQAQKLISRKADASMPEKFMYDAMGLNCPGHSGMGMLNANRDWPMLAQPTISEINWDQISDLDISQSTDYAGA